MLMIELWNRWKSTHPNAPLMGEMVMTDQDLTFLSSLIHPYSVCNGDNESNDLSRRSQPEFVDSADDDLGTEQELVEKGSPIHGMSDA